MAKKPSILFVCTGNSARSQMAEGFTHYYGGGMVVGDSAGTHPVGINPYAKWAMNEAGIDISGQTSDFLNSKDLSAVDYVVTLCGDARDSCPTMPTHVKVEHWELPDPARIRGTPEEVIKAFRFVRNQIERNVKNFLSEVLSGKESLRAAL